MSPVIVGGVPTPVPSAPTLVAPVNATYEDLSGEVEFSWTYNPTVPGNTQTGWAFRRKVAGATSYQWWNPGTSAWQAGQVFASGTPGLAQSITFPSGSWVNGNIYNWSVATVDTGGTGTYSPDDTVTAQLAPSVTVTAPVGTVGEAQPTITWAPSLPPATSQSTYRVILLTAAQATDGRATPDVGPSTFDTGQLSGSFVFAVTLTAPTYLPTATSYRAYVQITEAGGQASDWVYSAFTTSFDTPATPTLTATPGTDGTTGAPNVTITVQGNETEGSSFLGITVAQVNYSDDGGVTWWPLRNGSATLPADTQLATFVDNEGPPGFPRSYQAILTGTI